MNFIHLDASYYYYTFLKVFLSLDVAGCHELECFFITKYQFLKRKGFGNLSLLIKFAMKQG